MTTALRLATITLLLSVGCAQAQAPVELRVALVIGNAVYATAPLLNPANDARAMGDVLKGKNGVGMLYYAGHGLQLDWHKEVAPLV